MKGLVVRFACFLFGHQLDEIVVDMDAVSCECGYRRAIPCGGRARGDTAPSLACGPREALELLTPRTRA